MSPNLEVLMHKEPAAMLLQRNPTWITPVLSGFTTR